MTRKWLGGLLALAALSGCDDAPDAGTDGGGGDMVMTAQPDLTTGSTDQGPGQPQPMAVPVSPTGTDQFHAVVFDAQENIYAAGIVADTVGAAADLQVVVAKFTPSGALDTTFGASGFAIKNVVVGTSGEQVRSVVVQSTGKIVVAATVENATVATDRDVALVRFNPNGTPDNTFDGDGVAIFNLSPGASDQAYGLTRYSDDRLLVSGAQLRPASGATDTDFFVMRLSADGVPDNGFGTTGVFTLNINDRSASPRSVTLLPDGSIVGCGYMDDGGVVKPVVFKVTSAGQLDSTFAAPNGYFSQAVLPAVAEAYGLVLQGTSMVTVGYGRDTGMQSATDWVSLKLTAAGVLDTTWGTGGVVRIDIAGFQDNGRNLVALPNNRTLMVGGGRPTEMNSDAVMVVLTDDGTPDTAFAPNGRKIYDLGGTNDSFRGIALSPSNTKIVAVGIKGVAAPGNDDAVILVHPVN